MAEFKKQEELEAWLKEQPRAVSIVIAARAALRVLPVMVVEFSKSADTSNAVAGTIVLPVFRATAVSWSAAIYPNRRKDLARHAAAAAAAAIANAAAAYAAARAAAAARATAAALSFAAADAAAAAAIAATGAAAAADAASASVIADHNPIAANAGDDGDWNTVEVNAAIAADTVAAAARVAIWEAVSADATRLEGADALYPDELANEPLWTDKTPDWFHSYKEQLELILLTPELEPIWQGWVYWYRARVDGTPSYLNNATAEQNELLEVARATIDNATWDEGPAAVNAEIRRLEKEILGEGWEADAGYVEPGYVDGDEADTAQRPHPQSATAIGRRLAKDPTRYAAETEDLASLFDLQIGWWESKKPNQDEEDWQGHYEFLKQIRTDFGHLTTQIEQLKSQLTPEIQQSAGEQTLALQESLVTWLKKFSETILKSGKGTALLSMITGATTVIVSITSANPTIALAIATAAIGGPSLTKAAGALLGKKDKAADKPSENNQD